MRTHALTIRVYYEDTDFSGAVYHANYLRFMERARTEYLRACGVEQGAAMAAGAGAFGFVVRAMTIDFLRPARMDDLLSVETTPVELKAASFTLEQKVMRGAEMLATATVRCACVMGGRAARIPGAVKGALERGPPGPL
jgi:acyl-CoA thioester hydrolase